MMNKTRVRKLEEKNLPERVAFFTIHHGKASGVAWYNDNLRWENLSKPEFEQLTSELKKEGVTIKAINVVGVSPDGTETDGWEEREYKTPEQLIEIYDKHQLAAERLAWNAAAAKRKQRRKSFAGNGPQD